MLKHSIINRESFYFFIPSAFSNEAMFLNFLSQKQSRLHQKNNTPVNHAIEKQTTTARRAGGVSGSPQSEPSKGVGRGGTTTHPRRKGVFNPLPLCSSDEY